ncbi:MAG TPA: polysaccharide deacetylase family protein [Solirubrobacteraceae bacterium]
MRARLRRHAAAVALSSPLAPWTRRALRGRTKIVYAHHVGPPAPHLASFGPAFTAEQLDEHLTTLGRHFEFAPLADVLSANGADGQAASERLAVTFDDGFDLIGTGALDVLDAHGVKATTFVLTEMLDNRGLMWRNKLSAIRALRPEDTYVPAYNRLVQSVGAPTIAAPSELLSAAMRWDMARKDELADELWAACDMPALSDFLGEHRPYFTRDGLATWLAGGHGVGLHTATHPDCSRLDGDGVRAEILEPAERLRAELGVASLPFSYPFGRRCEPRHEPILLDAGVLDCALGIRGFSRRGTDPLHLERASIEGDMRFSVYGKAFLGVPR